MPTAPPSEPADTTVSSRSKAVCQNLNFRHIALICARMATGPSRGTLSESGRNFRRPLMRNPMPSPPCGPTDVSAKSLPTSPAAPTDGARLSSWKCIPASPTVFAGIFPRLPVTTYSSALLSAWRWTPNNQTGILEFDGIFVILHCGSQRTACYMTCVSLREIRRTPVIRNWGYLENWKSTASLSR